MEEKRRKENEIKQAAAAAKRAADEAKKAELARIENEKKWLQTDLDAIDKTRADMLRMIAERKFAEAGRAFAAVNARLKTDAGREHAKNVIECYEAMTRLKAFIIKSITAQPLKGGWPIGATAKDVAGASEQGLVISMSDNPNMTASMKPDWKDANVQTILRMTSMLVNRQGVTERERADYWLGAAALAYESGHEDRCFEHAEKCIEFAIRADDSARETAARLFPGLGP